MQKVECYLLAYILVLKVLPPLHPGLWLFDLSSRQICQEAIEEDVRGSVNSIWQSLQNIFELSVYAFTMAFSAPQQFWILSLISFFFVLASLLIFVSNRYSSGLDNRARPVMESVASGENMPILATIKQQPQKY